MISDNELFHWALKLWGADAQVKMAIEEMLELSLELVRCDRGRSAPSQIKKRITEEIADVELMLDQMKYLFKLDISELRKFRILKSERLEVLINEDKAKIAQPSRLPNRRMRPEG